MTDFRLNRITTDTGIMAEYVAYPDSICPACGNFPDYCQGHGEIGDPVGYAIVEMHETDNHTTCRYGDCLDDDDQVGDYALDDCAYWDANVMGDCSGRVEKVNGIIVCESCRNSDKMTTWSEMRVTFDAFLDSAYGDVFLADIPSGYATSRLLARIDPAQYRMTFNNWADANGVEIDSLIGPVDMP